MSRTLETDYLVVGCGAAGMAFADALITDCDADVVMVDRRHAPGGHWIEAYPFVRLHQPSAFYGVNSLPLGNEVIDSHGPNEGFYEQASGSEICAYFDRVMREKLLPSGRVRYFPMCSYVSPHRFVSRLSGEVYEVKVRKKFVDARYLETSTPSSTPPPFEVAPEARCVPVGELSRLAEEAEGYVIIGAGKTAMDACTWLLDQGVSPAAILWIKPREAWLQNRKFFQGGELVSTQIEGLALQMEAAAEASSVDDLFARLEAAEQFLRVDESVVPTMYRGPTLSTREVEQLRRIENVVRRGKVRRIERDTIVLDHGTVPTSRSQLHVHCAAIGLNPNRGVPVFAEDRITLQPIRLGLIPFNAAVVGYIEATRDDTDRKNLLCPPNPLPSVPLDWVRGMLIGMNAEYLWSKEKDIADWLERARLNLARGVRQRAGDPSMQQGLKRFTTGVRPAMIRMMQLLS